MYDEYVEKIKKLSSFKNKIYKFRFLIISILAVIIATVITFLVIVGNTSELLLPTNVVYGEKYEASCDALLSSIEGYENKLEGTDTWTSGLPDKPGVYYIRALSRRALGVGYSEEKKIEIAKRDLEISLGETSILYGEYPKLRCDNLSDGDQITNAVFEFEDLTSSNTLVNLSLSDLAIKNKESEDVTNCYNITYNSSNISFRKRDITLTPNGATKVYDGKPLEISNTYEISKNPGYDDEITVSSYEIKDINGNVCESVINPGRYNLEIKSFDILSGGSSTINNYNVTTRITPLIIEKRDILINTLSEEYTYDGQIHKNDEFELDESSSLAENDKLELKNNNTTITHFGQVENKLEVKVLDKDNNDVSNFYNIRYNYGSLNVLKKDISVTSESAEVTYDSLYHQFDDYEVDGLVSGDVIRSVNDVPTFKDSGTHVNNFTITIENDYDYNVSYIPGSIVINKREIAIKPIDTYFVYGDEITYDEYSYDIVSGTLGINDDITAIKVEVSYLQNDNNINPKNVGEYDISLTSYESSNYTVTFDDTSKLDISKLYVDINLLTMDDVIYDGKTHSYYDTESNYTSDIALPYDETIKVLVKYNDSDLLPLNADRYIITYDDFEVTGGSKENYNITSNYDILFDILKKDITITPIKFDDKDYDGIEYTYEISDNNFIGAEDLVLEDKVKIDVLYSSNGVIVDKPLNAGNYYIDVNSYEFTVGLESNYNVTLDSNSFIIYQRKVTLKANDIDDKVYDGIEITYDNPTPIISEGSFVDKEGFEINDVFIFGDNGDTKAINASKYHVNIISITANSNTLSSNYSITFEENTFEITPRDIKLLLVSNIDRKEYDGIIYDYGFEISPDTPIVSGEELIPEINYLGREFSYLEILNRDIYDISFGEVEAVNTVLSNYVIDKNDVSVFEVTPKHIEITPINFISKKYDGVEYIYDIYENNFVEKDDLISGDGITIYVDYKLNGENIDFIKDIGTYTLVVSKVEYTSSIETNYVIDKLNEVSFEIFKCDIKVILDKSISSKIYDGFVHEYSYFVEGIADNEEVTVNISYLERTSQETEILYVGVYDVRIESFNANDYTDNYDIDISDTDVFTVNKKPVEIKPIDITLTYGDTLSYDKNEYEFVDGSLVDIDDNKAIEIEVGYYKDNVKVEPKNADIYDIVIESHLSRNYDVTYSVGKLIIKKFELYIKLLQMDSVIYDGLDHIYPDTYDNYESDQTLPYDEQIKIFVSYNNSDNLPHNYNEYNYIITYKDFKVLGESEDNYNINCQTPFVVFKILKRDIAIAPRQISDKEYDGIGISYNEYFGDNVFDIIDGEMVDDEEFVIDNVYIYLDGVGYEKVTDANTYIVKILLEDISPNSLYPNTLKSNYNIDLTETKSFSISKRSVTFTLSSPIYIKEYDGTTYTGFTFSSDRVVSGETIIADINYIDEFDDSELRNRGTYEVTMNIPNDSDHYKDGAKASNYNIDYSDVKEFIITPKDLNLAFTHQNNDSKLYDSLCIGNDIIEYSNDGLLESYDKLIVDILFSGKLDNPVDAGEYLISFDIDNLVIVPKNTGYITRKENYNIISNSITYSINKRKVVFELSSSTLSMTYDGIRYDNLFSINIIPVGPTCDGLVSGEVIDAHVKYDLITNNYHDSYIRNAGTYLVSMTLSDSDYKSGAKPINYIVDYSDTENFEVLKKELTISYVYDSLSKIYDAQEIPYSVKIDGNAISDTIVSKVTYTNNDTLVVSDINPKDAYEYTISIVGYDITDSNMNITRMDNYSYTTPNDIIYEIEKRKLTYLIDGDTTSITYNGKYHDLEFEAVLDPLCDGLTPLEDDIEAETVYLGKVYEDTNLRNADTYDISIEVDFKNYKKSNYLVTLDSKTFTIDKASLTIEFKNNIGSKVYDGLVIQQEALILNYIGLVDTDNILPVYKYNNSETKPKNAGVYNIVCSSYELVPKSVSITTRIENYIVTNNDYLTYTIEKFGVTLSPYDAAFIYSENYIVYNLGIEVIPTSGSMPEGEDISAEKVFFKQDDDLLLSIKDAGTYQLIIDEESILPKNDLTILSNYNITLDDTKTHIIIPRKLVFGLVSKINNITVHAKEYDGTIYEYSYELKENTSLVAGESVVPTINYLGRNLANTVIKEIDEYDVSFGEIKYGDNVKPGNYQIDINDTDVFRVTIKQVTISLVEESDTYSGKAYTYDESEYLVDPKEKYYDLIHNKGLIVKVKYYDFVKNEISEIKNAGKYYIKIDAVATTDVIDSIPSLKDNFNFILNDEYVPFEMNRLKITISPISYEEDGVEKFAAEKIYDGKAYIGYDSSKFLLEVEDGQMPEGEGFYITPKLNESTEINVKDACAIDSKNNEYKPYELMVDSSCVFGNSSTNINNYSISRSSYQFVIKRRNVEIGLNGYIDGEPYYLDKIYDGNYYYSYDMNSDTKSVIFEGDESLFNDVSFDFDIDIVYPTSDKSFKNAGIYKFKIVDTIENPITVINDSKNNFNIKLNNYSFEIFKRDVVIDLIPNSTSKVYDGYEYLYDGTYIVTSDIGFIGNSYLVPNVVGDNGNEIRHAGKYTAVISLDKSMMVGDLISNYNIESDSFSFTVTKRPLSIKTATRSFVYNGDYQYDTSYEILDDSLPLAEGDSLIVESYTPIRDVGSVKNEVSYRIRYADGSTTHDSYDFAESSMVRGRLTVTAKNLTLVSKSAEFVYNGENQECKEFEVVDGLCESDQIVFTNDNVPSVKKVGSVVNNDLSRSYTIKSKTMNNVDTMSNYNIVYSSGKLSVKKRTVNIIGFEPLSKEYSNKVPSVSKSYIIYEDSINGNIVSSDGVKISLFELPINVGHYTSRVTVTISENANCYDLNIADSALIEIEIYERTLNLTTSSHMWEYDGDSHEHLSYDSVKRLLSGHSIEVVSGSSIRDIGTIDNHLNIIVKDKTGNDISYNYRVEETAGTLEIVAGVDIGIIIDDLEYTGLVANIKQSDLSLNTPEGLDASLYELVSYSVNSVNAVEIGNDYIANINYTYRNNKTMVERNRNNIDVTFNIIPISLSISINSKTVDFTGSRFKINEDEFTITSGNLLAGHTLKIVGDNEGYNGSIKVGLKSYVVIDSNNNDISSCYNVTAKSGRITVNKIPLNVSTEKGEWSYDGTAHYNKEFTIKENISSYGLKAIADSYPTITDAGSISNRLKISIQDILGRTSYVDNDGYELDYSKTFDISYSYGTLIVNKAYLYIKSNDIYAQFDGSYYQSNSNDFTVYITEKEYSSALGDSQTNVNGSLVLLDVICASYCNPTYRYNAGSSLEPSSKYPSNEYSVVAITDLNGKDISNNFKGITMEYGEVNIENRALSITTLGNEKIYDGTTLYSSGISINVGSDTYQMVNDGYQIYTCSIYINGNKFDISLLDDSNIIDIGTGIDKYRNLQILNSEGSNVTAFFNITSKLGKLTITGN